MFALCGFPLAVEGLPQPPSPSLQPAEWEGEGIFECLFNLWRSLFN